MYLAGVGELGGGLAVLPAVLEDPAPLEVHGRGEVAALTRQADRPVEDTLAGCQVPSLYAGTGGAIRPGAEQRAPLVGHREVVQSRRRVGPGGVGEPVLH